VADEASVILEDAVDGAMGPVPSDIDDGAFHEELSFDLPDNDLIEETSISPFASERPDDAVDDVMGSVLKDAEDSAVEEELPPGLLARRSFRPASSPTLSLARFSSCRSTY